MVIGLFGDVVLKMVFNFKILVEGIVVRGLIYCLNGKLIFLFNVVDYMIFLIFQYYMYYVQMLVCICRYCVLQVCDGKRLIYEGVCFY